MDLQPTYRPLNNLGELDLDAGLTPAEREIVATTPFYGLAKTLVGLFVIALCVLLLGYVVQSERRERSRVTELRARIELGTEQAASATPGGVTTLVREWFFINRQIRNASFPVRLRSELDQKALVFAHQVLRQGEAHLSALEYLDLMEAAVLAESMAMLLDTLGPAVDAQAHRPPLDRVLDDLTAAAIRLAAPGASARDLRRAAGLLYRLSTLAQPSLRLEYTTTATALLERARSAEERGVTSSPLGPGEVEARIEFADALSSMLQGTGSAITRIAAGGEDLRILMVQGNGPPVQMAEQVLGNPAVRERLRMLSFLTLRAHNGEQSVDVDIETLETRIVR